MIVRESFSNIHPDFFQLSADSLSHCYRPGIVTPAETARLVRYAEPLDYIAAAIKETAVEQDADNFSVRASHLAVGARRFGLNQLNWYAALEKTQLMDEPSQKAWDWIQGLQADDIKDVTNEYMAEEAFLAEYTPEGEVPQTPDILDTRREFPALTGFSTILEAVLKDKNEKPETIRNITHGALLGPVIIRNLLIQQGA